MQFGEGDGLWPNLGFGVKVCLIGEIDLIFQSEIIGFNIFEYSKINWGLKLCSKKWWTLK